MSNHNFIDLSGKRFGHLAVLKRADNTADGHAQWLCQCDCGRQTIVAGKHLRSGHTTSCGHEHRTISGRTMIEGFEAKRVDGVAVHLLSNQRKVRTDSLTGVTGVKRTQTRTGEERFMAQITVGGVRHHLGTFKTLDEAVQARHKGEQKFIPKQK